MEKISMGNQYKVDKTKLVDVAIYIGKLDDRIAILTTSQYDDLKMSVDMIAERNASIAEIEAKNATLGPDEKPMPVPEEMFIPAIVTASLPIECYQREWAKFLPVDYALDTAILTESSAYGYGGATQIDSVAARHAKMKYLLREWSLDIKIRITTLNSMEQLHRSTISEIDQLAPQVIYGFLMAYDETVYGM